MPAPDVTPKKHLQRGSERHGKKWSDHAANDQAPDKDRHAYCHRMYADIVPDDPWRVNTAFHVVDDDENYGHDDRVGPIAPLKCRDENSGYPANDDPDIWNHCEHDHHCADHRRKVQADCCQCRADENAINQADKKLTTEIRHNIRVDF